MAGDGAEICKLTHLRRSEVKGRRSILADDDRGACRILIDDDVMLGALAVYQIDLDQFTLMHHERGVDLVVYIATDADIDHAPAGNPGLEGEDGRRVVADEDPVCRPLGPKIGRAT